MPMSKEHKEALALGRQEARAIKRYLSALSKRRPGRPVTKDSLQGRLDRITARIEAEQDALIKVGLLQTKLDIEHTLSSLEESANVDELEAGFIKNARPYSERKGISYTAWRQAGVPAEVLRKAGIPETRRR